MGIWPNSAAESPIESNWRHRRPRFAFWPAREVLRAVSRLRALSCGGGLAYC